MTTGWDLLVARADLSQTQVIERPVPEPGPGEVVLKVDRVGLTANNVTYALAGDSLRYWEFFPAEDPWGRVPLWGFADVTASEVDAIPPGTRFYGYLPTSSHLVVRPEGANEHGFRDAAEHRTDLPRVYNRYHGTDGDPTYASDDEDLHILFRPLFVTSLMLDDFLADNDFFGAEQIVMSSASSKTAYGTAFLTSRRSERPRLVGLTSVGNVSFTRSLGCYDDVVSYDDLESIPSDVSTAFVDVAGNQKLRARIHEHFGEKLVYDASVGAAHMEDITATDPDLSGPAPEFFFAPSQIQKRREDWGPGGIAKLHADAWRDFAPVVRNWVDVREGHGPEGLRSAWLEVLSGESDPKTGHVIAL